MGLKAPSIDVGFVIMVMLRYFNMELIRIMLILYLLRNHLGITYEYPPWYSNAVWVSISELKRKGIVELYNDRGFVKVKLTGEGSRRLREYDERFRGMLISVGPILLMNYEDLVDRVKEITFNYANMPLNTLASIALSDYAHELYYLNERSIEAKLLWEASSIISRLCEGPPG
mgnify:CR=1 FL=1